MAYDPNSYWGIETFQQKVWVQNNDNYLITTTIDKEQHLISKHIVNMHYEESISDNPNDWLKSFIEYLDHKNPSLMQLINYTQNHNIDLFHDHAQCEVNLYHHCKCYHLCKWTSYGAYNWRGQ